MKDRRKKLKQNENFTKTRNRMNDIIILII